MQNWNKRKRQKPSNSTPGKEKGLLPTPADKCIAKGARSYKRKDYANWLEKTSKKNK